MKGAPIGFALVLPSSSKKWLGRITKGKPSSLPSLIVSDEGKKFYNIDTRLKSHVGIVGNDDEDKSFHDVDASSPSSLTENDPDGDEIFESDEMFDEIFDKMGSSPLAEPMARQIKKNGEIEEVQRKVQQSKGVKTSITTTTVTTSITTDHWSQVSMFINL